MLSIGQFSKASGLTVKTLRFYQEQGILVPSAIDDQTGYRYYDESKLETARVIQRLRALDFGLRDIAEILRHNNDDADILEALHRQQTLIENRMASDREIATAIQDIIRRETESRRLMAENRYEVTEKTLAPTLIASIRMKARYQDCGKAFGQLGRAYGRHLCGPGFLLHYDEEYKEHDADFEVCFPIRRRVDEKDGMHVRELPGGNFLTLLHKGPYENLGRSYELLMKAMNTRGHELKLPIREVYLKGPGMIFRGNPQKYLTEIQMQIPSSSSSSSIKQ